MRGHVVQMLDCSVLSPLCWYTQCQAAARNSSSTTLRSLHQGPGHVSKWSFQSIKDWHQASPNYCENATYRVIVILPCATDPEDHHCTVPHTCTAHCTAPGTHNSTPLQQTSHLERSQNPGKMYSRHERILTCAPCNHQPVQQGIRTLRIQFISVWSCKV